MDEWAPQGDKSAGYPPGVTSCGIACSYDDSCTAFSSGHHYCAHGFADAVCNGTGGHPRGSPPTHIMQRGPGVGFQRNFSFATTDFDDTGWKTTTLPHDPLINQTFDPAVGEGSGFVPRKVIWYRKEFVLPEELRGQHIFLRFDGAFQFTEVYLNGAHLQDHNTGNVSWTCRLDNATSLFTGKNVLALRVDPSFGSGHWYEGGGINRPITLVATPKLHFVEGGVFPNPNSDGTSLRVSAEIEDLDGGSASHVVSFTLRDEDGAVVATANQPMTTKGSVVLKPATKLSTWSPQTPVTYTLTARVGEDELNLTTAARVFDWKGKKAKINGLPLELQGFSHHPSFAGMGAMTNPRLGLFLAQTTKALGVNCKLQQRPQLTSTVACMAA